jgi:AcrR family transcriptional regulator
VASAQDVAPAPGGRGAGTRALILAAAVDCLAEDGYAAATTLRIQARAGVTRGRLLHHFPSRDALLLAAAQHLAAVRLAEAEREAGEALRALAGRARVEGATAALWSTFREPAFWAAMELWIAARTDHGLRECLRPQEQQLGASLRRFVAALYGPAAAAHPRFPAVRDLLLSSMRGVALTYAFDERDPAADRHLILWNDIASTLLGSDGPS